MMVTTLFFFPCVSVHDGSLIMYFSNFISFFFYFFLSMKINLSQSLEIQIVRIFSSEGS